MQDRFKFRVWDKVSKRYFFLELKFGDNGYHPLFIEKPIFEQCTGLKDKNGKLIYEGDWLKTKDGYYCYVVWDDCSFWVESPGSLARDLEHSEFYGDCEVVGNINENPDLMENKDE